MAVLVAGSLVLLAPAPARAADVTVNTLADSANPCTLNQGARCLREAIAAAGPGGAITFAPDVRGTIILGRGTLVIANPVTITGPGASSLTVDAANAVRVFSVPATGSTAISGLTIQRGNNPGVGGGGIYAAHALTLTDVVVRANTASGAAPHGNGGGIYVDTGGTLIIDRSTIGGPNPADANTAPNSNGGGIFLNYDASLTMRNGSVVRGNSARGNGGGIDVQGPASSTGTSTVTITGSTVAGNTAGFGGGIDVFGPLTLDSSTIGGPNPADANTAERGGGIAVNGDSALRTVRNGSVIRGNRASASGGGIFATGPTTITGSTVAGNTASTSGGGIYTFYRPAIIVDGSTIGGPNAADATTAANGGGIYLDDSGPLTVRNGSVIRGNVASGNGGGVYANGPTTVRDSTVRDNRTTGTGTIGGGIVNYGTTEITGSTISGNTAVRGGGGIANESGGTLDAGNITVSGNTAQGVSGGGGILNSGTLALRNSTVANNTAPMTTFGGGGIRHAGGTLDLGNIILTANTAQFGGADYHQTGGATTNRGHNFVTFTAGTNFEFPDGDGDIRGNTMPGLGPLADNGGPTQTRALLPGSPALDAGSNALCAETLVGNRDQRGVSRPQGTQCDIGAFEVAPAAPTLAPATYPVGTAGGPVTLTGANLSAITTVTVDGAAAPVLAASPDGTQITVRVAAGAAGATVSVIVTNPGTAGATGTLVYTAPAAAPPPREPGVPAGMPQVQPPMRPAGPAMGMPPPGGVGALGATPAVAPTPLPAPMRR